MASFMRVDQSTQHTSPHIASFLHADRSIQHISHLPIGTLLSRRDPVSESQRVIPVRAQLTFLIRVM